MQNGHLFARGILELLFYFVFDKFSEILFAQVERFREKRLFIAQIIQNKGFELNSFKLEMSSMNLIILNLFEFKNSLNGFMNGSLHSVIFANVCKTLANSFICRS